MSEKNFHSLFWDMLDHLKTKYLTLDQHLVVDKNLWAPTRLKSVWEDIPRDSEEDILKDKVVSITCRTIGFPQKLLLSLFFSKETTEKISAGLLLYDLQNAFASLASLSDGLFFSVSTAEKVAQAKSIAEFGFEATTEVLDQLNPQKDDVPIFDYLKKEIELRILNLDLVVQKKHPIQSQLNDELTQGLSIKEGKIRIEEAINQARVELEWLQQVVRDWDSNVALLKRQFQEDIHDAQAVFMTADEFFSTIDRNDEPWFDQLVGLGAA